MGRHIGIVGLLIGLLAATSTTAATSGPEGTALRRAAERGDLIYDLDQAGSVSTDELLKQLPDPASSGIAGWIVEARGDRLDVTYYRSDHDRYTAAFTAQVQGKAVVASHMLAAGENARLTPVEIRMIQAREIAKRQNVQPCTAGAMNTVVLPPAAPDDPISVYVLTAQVKTGEYPAGGHYEFDINAQGDVVSSRKFTYSCLSLSSRAPGGSTPAGLVLTHMLDVTPTEIHVYLSKLSRLPVYVLTPVSRPASSDAHRIWAVNGDRIELVQK
jgi:hypothetical protein